MLTFYVSIFSSPFFGKRFYVNLLGKILG